MDIEKLEQKIDDNAKKIIENIKRIEQNSAKIDDNSNKIQQNSYALDILKDYKKGFNRWHTIALIFMILWILTVGYLVYVLNDIGTIEETNRQEITDVDTIENSSIANGDINGQN